MANNRFWERAFKWYQWFNDAVYIGFFEKRQFEKNVCKMQIFLVDSKSELDEQIQSLLRNKPDYQFIDVLDYRTATKVRDYYNNYTVKQLTNRNGKRGRLTYREIIEKYKNGEINFD